jgi:hypothetical protein
VPGWQRQRIWEAGVLNPNTPNTGRTALFVEVEVRDHEVGTWSLWSATDRSQSEDVNVLLQQAIDAGFDDVRASVHNTGCLDDPILIVA